MLAQESAARGLVHAPFSDDLAYHRYKLILSGKPKGSDMAHDQGHILPALHEELCDSRLPKCPAEAPTSRL